MGILDEDVAAVRAASDIVGIVSQYLQLRRVGRRWTGLCPFHAERTPSFSVNGELGLYICYGCQAKGDVITFVREVEHLDFVGAVEWLASKAGVSLHYTERVEGEGRKRRARLVEVMERAVDWYHERLLSSPDAGTARRYLRERGIEGDVVREYRIGWAPDGWDEVCKALRLNEDDARDSGLGFRNSRNRLQDTFRARVMFPIRDAQGDAVSFGGRILPGSDDPRNHGKYKNTPETPLYHKSKVLYGLDRSKTGIVSADTAVICEGYTDVIGFARSGVPLAVATCGTALTDEHVKLLRRYARRFVLAFDADGAGLAAAEKFYRWERDHDLEVAVADLPPGQDPADVARSDPERLAAAVSGATPFLRFRLDRAFAVADLTTPEGRAKIAERGMAIIAEHPVELVRDQYLMDVASRCRLEPELLRPQLKRAVADAAARPRGEAAATTEGRRPESGDRRGPAPERSPDARSDRHDPFGGRQVANEDPGSVPPPGTSPRPARPDQTVGPAMEVLRHAVHAQDEIAPWLRDEFFRDPQYRAVLRALRDNPTVAAAVTEADPETGTLLARLAVDEPTSEPFDAVRRLGTEVARAELTGLRLGALSNADPGEMLAESAFLSRCIDELRVADTSRTALERLLAWLEQRVGDGG
jgi:DNA primase